MIKTLDSSMRVCENLHLHREPSHDVAIPKLDFQRSTPSKITAPCKPNQNFSAHVNAVGTYEDKSIVSVRSLEQVPGTENRGCLHFGSLLARSRSIRCRARPSSLVINDQRPPIQPPSGVLPCLRPIDGRSRRRIQMRRQTGFLGYLAGREWVLTLYV